MYSLCFRLSEFTDWKRWELQKDFAKLICRPELRSNTPNKSSCYKEIQGDQHNPNFTFCLVLIGSAEVIDHLFVNILN